MSKETRTRQMLGRWLVTIFSEMFNEILRFRVKGGSPWKSKKSKFFLLRNIKLLQNIYQKWGRKVLQDEFFKSYSDFTAQGAVRPHVTGKRFSRFSRH